MSSLDHESDRLPTTESNISQLAFASVRQFVSFVRQGMLSRPSQRSKRAFRVDDGRIYQVFRETDSRAAPAQSPTVLVVGFQLRVLGAHPFPHWVFQRCCLLTTPFWSGLPGFSVKLWMVDPVTKRYLGIYDWRGLTNTWTYATALARVLRPLSTPDSVWYRIVPECTLDRYLADHATNLALDASE